MENKRRKKKKDENEEEYNRGFIEAICSILVGILLGLCFLWWSLS